VKMRIFIAIIGCVLVLSIIGCGFNDTPRKWQPHNYKTFIGTVEHIDHRTGMYSSSLIAYVKIRVEDSNKVVRYTFYEGPVYKYLEEGKTYKLTIYETNKWNIQSAEEIQ